MAKRRLSQQQRNRIAQKQTSENHAPGTGGIVIGHYGKEVDIAPVDKNGDVNLAGLCRCHFRANLATLVCGDLVHYTPPSTDGQTGVVEAIEPRATLIERPRPYQPPKPVAANIDTIVLVVSVEPPPIASLIDRYLIAAENARLSTILLFNKHDLYCKLTADHATRLEVESLITLYSDLGYRCYFGSAKTGQAIDCNHLDERQTLVSLFQQHRSMLVGQSGVGKSSIINAIAPSANALVGNVSDSTAKGRHTTTTAAVYFIASDDIDNAAPSIHQGSIIDSPGIREFGLWHLTKQQVIDGMPEFRQFASECKFRDCDHSRSAGCAVQRALAEKQISPSRHASYLQIMDSLEQAL